MCMELWPLLEISRDACIPTETHRADDVKIKESAVAGRGVFWSP